MLHVNSKQKIVDLNHEAMKTKVRILLSNDLDDLSTLDLSKHLHGREDIVPVDDYIRNVRDSLKTDQKQVISMFCKQHGPASSVQGLRSRTPCRQARRRY